MSDAKRPGGSRDISDLKARLGLKKGAAAPATGQTRANGGSGGVVAPPGMNLPPPPGVQPQYQQPPAPVIPNAADDPFGAMNAMAAVGHGPARSRDRDRQRRQARRERRRGRQGRDDREDRGPRGRRARSSGSRSAGSRRTPTSTTTASSAPARSSAIPRRRRRCSSVKRTLSELDGVLDDMKTQDQLPPRSGGRSSSSTAIALKLDVKSELVFRAKQNALDHEVAGQILSFYAGVAEVKGDDRRPQQERQVRRDDAQEGQGRDRRRDAQGQRERAARRPAQVRRPDPGADRRGSGSISARSSSRSPACTAAARAPRPRKCGEGESPSGLAYRNEPGGTPIKGDLATGGSDSVPTKKVVPLLQNGVRDAVIKGNEPGDLGVLLHAPGPRDRRPHQEADRGRQQARDAAPGRVEQEQAVQLLPLAGL